MRGATLLQSDPADPPAFAAARRMCRPWDDLAFAVRFLDRTKRDAVCSTVAFFGMIADAIGRDVSELSGGHGLRQHPAVVSPAGGCCGAGESDALLAAFRGRLDQIFDGGLELPSPAARSSQQHALHAFARTVARFDVRREHFLRFADERARDATITRYPTWTKLEQHCRATGGCVAVAMGEVLGLQHSDASRAIERLGAGLRLVQILRDVNADAARGRIYLPLEDLVRCRYSERELIAGVASERRDELWGFERERARKLLNQGTSAIGWIAGDRSRLFAATVVALGETTLRRPVSKPSLTTAMRVRQLPAAWRLARACEPA
ncbi:MAG: squalene/phytoene synthase family protein [Planctomycetota bacterium]|nr:squalene/phytoene synthase family protein [Planctomycetota bacterium]